MKFRIIFFIYIIILCLDLNAQTGTIKVINKCPFTVWTQGVGNVPGGNANLHGGVPEAIKQGDSVTYSNIPLAIGGGRLYGYYKQPPAGLSSFTAPVSSYNQFVEFTIDNGTNYNISYVDQASLPVKVVGVGNGQTCNETASLMTSKRWKEHLQTCPTQVIYQDADNGIGLCMASYNYCIISDNASTPYCTKMTAAYGSQILDMLYDDCVNNHGLSVAQCTTYKNTTTITDAMIYGGVFSFGGQPWQVASQNGTFWDWIAAINRGTTIGVKDSALYYLGPQQVNGIWTKPYNEYAEWVHRGMNAEIYAFSTDDHQDHSGFQRCVNTSEIDVTWCPCDTICHLKLKNLLHTDIACFGAKTGTITVVDSGGVAPLQYSIDSGATWVASPNFTNLDAGTYKVYVKSLGSCIDSGVVTILQPEVSAFISGSAIVCNDGTSTSPITITFKGQGPWNVTYAIDGVAQPPITNILTSPYVFQSKPDAHSYTLVSVSGANSALPCMGSLIGGKADISVTKLYTVHDGYYCAPASTTLSIDDNGGTYNWYTVPTGGASIYTGTSFTTPVLGNAGAVYYVQDANNVAYGAAVQGYSDDASLSSTIRYNDVNNSINFTSLDNVTLNKVTAKFDIYGAGNVNIIAVLKDLTANTTQQTTTPFFSENNVGPSYEDVPMGFTLIKNHNYNISIISSPGAGRMEFLTYINFNNYPQNIGKLNLTGSKLGAWSYPAIFNWDMTWGVQGGECRTAVKAIPGGINAAVVSKTDENCNNANAGAITVAPSSGTAPFTYNWSNGNNIASINGLTAGNYSVTITETNGCSTVLTSVINPATSFTLSLGLTNSLCNNFNNGSASLTTTNGQAPFSYKWSDGQSLAIANNLAPGSYQVTVTDQNNCTQTANVTITEPSVLSLSLTNTNVTLNGASDGAVTSLTGGGSLPYSYLWNDNAITKDLTNLKAGNYSLTVTDANGCKISSTTLLTEPPSLIINNNVTNVSCNGFSDGAASVPIVTGTPPFKYLWSNAETNSTLSNVKAGTYLVTVTDASNATSTASVYISEPSPINLIINSVDLKCNGSSDGTIGIIASGGASTYKYLWTNGATDNNLINLSVGNYLLTVTDQKGCTQTANVLLSEPTALSLSLTNTNISLNGASDGAVISLTGGGSLPYSYLWNDNEITKDLTNVKAGNYSLTVTDANGCKISSTTLLSEPPSLIINNNVTNVTCNGYSDGAASISVVSGTSPFKYQWSNAETNSTISNVKVGTYLVTVTDASNATSTASIVISEPNPINLIVNSADSKCNASSDGTIGIIASGGTSTYKYLWTNGDTDNNLINLSVGNYLLTVTDQKGCTQTANVSISEPSALSLSLTVNDAQSQGGSDGSVISIAGGGTPSYTYLWSDNAITKDIINVSTGFYTLTIKDGNGCTVSKTEFVNEPPFLVVNKQSTNVTCRGYLDGTATVNVVTGTSPYTYYWSDAETTNTISNIKAGTYFVTVTDASNAKSIVSIDVSEPSAINLNVIAVNSKCSGDANGTISIVASGGTPMYNYAWNNYATDKNLSNLAVGNYLLTVTDQNNCAKTANVSISEPSALSLLLTVKDAQSQGGSDGSVISTAGGGTPIYSYLWSNNAITKDIINVSTGFYTLTVKDGNGCTISQTEFVNEPPFLTTTTTIVNTSCNGFTDGSAKITVLSGTPAYVYNWPNGETNDVVNNLKAGTYFVTISDAANLKTTVKVVITEPSQIKINSLPSNISCNGSSDGSIMIIPSGGAGGYTYLWNSLSTLQNLSALAVGNYSLTVTDQFNCTNSTLIGISEPAKLITKAIAGNASCGFVNGTAQISLVPNNGAAQYLWNTLSNKQSLSNLQAGKYVVTVSLNGCSVKDSVEITNQPYPLILDNFEVKNVSCNESLGSNGKASMHTQGGIKPLLFKWSSTVSITDSTYSSLSKGNHIVTVTNNDGTCAITKTINIDQDKQPLPILFTKNPTCHLENGELNVVIYNGTPPFEYLWSTGETTNKITNLAPNNYSISILDSAGCSNSATKTLINKGNMNSDFNFTPSIPDVINAEVKFYDYSKSDGKIVEWQWSFGDGDVAINQNPVHRYEKAGTYTIFLNVTDSSKCQNKIFKEIEVKDVFAFYVANAFTPNVDGINELFIPKYNNINVLSYSFCIFNRWGDQVFCTNDVNEGWNGRLYNSGDALAPQGVYSYKINIKDISGSNYEYLGSLSLIR